jgi:prepilin-type processing-associated H-X9-DG protein
MYSKYCNDIRSHDNFTTHDFVTVNRGGGQTPRWFKLQDYKPASNRAMVADSFDWLLEGQQWNGVGPWPQQTCGGNSAPAYPGSTRTPGTTFDYYRHGKYPPVKYAAPTNYFLSIGGNINYNILYADGHVLNTSDRADAYRGLFNMFPVVGTPGSRKNNLPN